VGEGNKDNYLIKEINLWRNVGDGDTCTERNF
jgi:hypothetical protein